MNTTLFDKDTAITESVLNTIAHMPTTSLPVLMADDFAHRLSDRDFMRIAVLLARKSHDEGGCPIGAVIIDNSTRRILGKGHNTLVQESPPLQSRRNLSNPRCRQDRLQPYHAVHLAQPLRCLRHTAVHAWFQPRRRR